MTSVDLIPEQRRREILNLLRWQPVQSYRQLTDKLGVSHMTVRRDAAMLAEQGRVRLTHGGVAAVQSVGEEPSRLVKADVNTPEKNAIAQAAAELVRDGMTIYLDAGTTIQSLRPLVEERTDLTIVTNDIATATAFLDHSGAELIVVGGRVDKANQSTVGRLAAMTLGELSLDLALISCSSWDARRGLTTPVEAKIDLKRTAISVTSRPVLLADSTKYGSYAKHRVARLDELDTVITDENLEEGDAARVEAAGVELMRVRAHPA